MLWDARCLIQPTPPGSVGCDKPSLQLTARPACTLSNDCHAPAAKQVGDTGSPTSGPSASSRVIRYSGHNWWQFHTTHSRPQNNLEIVTL
eukprot:5428277-Karenia_brevis.AAC.1